MLTPIWSATDIIFCHFRPFFALLLQRLTSKIKTWIKCKKHLEILLLSFYVHHKSRSYDIWFLRYKVQRIMFFDILCHFLHFDFDQKIKILKNKNNACRYYHFTLVFLRYQAWQTHFFVILGYFCPFTPIINYDVEVCRRVYECSVMFLYILH